MKCKFCGKYIDNDSQFCEHCGAKVKKSKNGLWIILSVVVTLVLLTLIISVGDCGAVMYYNSNSNYDDEYSQEYIENSVEPVYYVPQESFYMETVSSQEQARNEAEQKAKAEAEEASKHELAKQGYVDLGLPSGTLWKNKNEGADGAHYTYDEAISKFGDKLPSREQYDELKSFCTFTMFWGDNSRLKVVGPNNKSITFPSACYEDANGDCYGAPNGFYWSSTTIEYLNDAYCFYFYDAPPAIGNEKKYYKMSVRLVH